MADPDFGIDLACTDDIDGGLSLISGIENLGNAIVRRLSTPRGGLFYDPDYGLDLRHSLSAGITEAQLQTLGGAIEAECRKDDRIQDCTAAVTYNRASRALKVKLQIDTAEGPFALVLAVSAVTVELLSLQS